MVLILFTYQETDPRFPKLIFLNEFFPYLRASSLGHRGMQHLIARIREKRKIRR
jgi:hypothetical protein